MLKAKAGQYLNLKKLKLDTWADRVKIGRRADILTIFALSALIGKHTLIHLHNGNLCTTINTVSSDHDKLLNKCEIHLAYVGNGLFCELKPHLSGTTIVSGTTTRDVNLTGTTISADSGTTTRNVKFSGDNTDTSSTAYGIGETVPFDVLDSSGVKPPSLLDIPEVLYTTSTISHEAVIGSITSDTETIRALIASNDGKLRLTDAPCTTKLTKTIYLPPPPVPCEHQHEHITRSQVNIKDIWINLKRISQTDLELWSEPKSLTYYKNPLTAMQRSHHRNFHKTILRCR